MSSKLTWPAAGGSGPGLTEALQQAQAAAARGDLAGAGRIAEAALDRGLRHPFLLNLKALRLEQEGQIEGALASLKEARKLAPGDVGVLNGLGILLMQVERPAEALEAIDAALAVQPDVAPLHANRGAALEALGRLREAEGAFERAVERSPGQPIALTGLASLAGRRGDHDRAFALAEEALRALPGHPQATLAAAGAEIGLGRPADAEGRLRRFLAERRAPSQPYALAECVLGDALDAQGRATEAFAAYASGNQALKRWYAPRFEGRQTAAAYAHALADSVRRPPRAQTAEPAPAPGPNDPRSHVFLMGFPRSGTTVLENVLAAHPDVTAMSEREALIDGVRALLTNPRDLAPLRQAEPATLERLRGAYWARVREQGLQVSGRVFVDKHPLNTLKLPLIARLFPQARILFALRDPRDVVLSCFRRRFEMSPPMYACLTPEGAAELYDATMRLAGAVFAKTDLAWTETPHEWLVADFDAEAQRLCRFLDLPWDQSMRRFAEHARDRGVATPSGAQLAGGLSREGVGAWRRYRDQLAPVLPVLQPWAERFGYPAD